MLIYFAMVCIYMNLLPVNSVSECGSSWVREQQSKSRQKIWHQMPGDGRIAPGDPGDAKINDRELKTLS